MRPERRCRLTDRIEPTGRAGQGLIEYALLLMLIAVVVVATLIGLGKNATTTYAKVNCGLVGAGNTASCITLNQLGPFIFLPGPARGGPNPGPSSITFTLNQPSTPGTMLTMTAGNSNDPIAIGQFDPVPVAGWQKAVAEHQPGNGTNEIWYYPNNPGNISSWQFNIGAPVTPVTWGVEGNMSEWAGAAQAAPLDQCGARRDGGHATTSWVSNTSPPSTAGLCVPQAPITASGEMAITMFSQCGPTPKSFSSPYGWSRAFTTATWGSVSEYALGLKAGSIVTENVAFGGPWAGSPPGPAGPGCNFATIATFRPA